MESLNFVIDADCAPAIGALDRTSQGIDSLGGKRATVGIQTTGASSAIRDLQSVNNARVAAAGNVSLGVDTSGIQQGRSELGALRGDFRQAARDMDGLSGSRSLGFSDTGSIRGLVSDLGSASSGLTGLTTGAGRADSSLDDLSSGARGVGSDFSDARREVGGLSQDLQDLGSVRMGDGATKQLATLGQQAGQVQGLTRGITTNLSGTSSGLGPAGGGSLGGGPMGQWGRASGSSAPPPGWGPPGGGGRPPGGAGGGRGGFDSGGGGGLGMYGAMFSAVGIVESLAAGAGGMLAASEVIKQVPDLALAANGAMGQLSKGIREAGTSAIGEGVPALHALGGELHGLGTEVGQVGVEHLGETLAAASSLAGTATRAIAALDPAVSSSITGLEGVGNALLTGLSSPSNVQGIRSIGDSLSNLSNQSGIESLTSGLSTTAVLAGKVAADVAGSVGNLTGLGGPSLTPAIQSGLGAGIVTKNPLIGLLTAAGTLQAQEEESAGRQDLVTPGVVGGTAGGMAGYKLGGAKGGAAGYVIGDLANVGAAQADKSAGTGSLFSDVTEYGTAGATLGAFGGPWGAAGGFAIGSAVGFAKNQFAGDSDTSTSGGSDRDAGGFPTGLTQSGAQNAGRYGWQQDDQGNMRPGTAGDRAYSTHLDAVRKSQALTGGGNLVPALAHGQAPADTGSRGPSNPLQDLFRGPLGPGSSGPAGEAALQRLNSAMQTTSAGTAQLTQRNQQLAPTFQRTAQNATTLAQPMQQLQQRAQQLQPSFQQVSQGANLASTQVQRLQQTVQPTVQSVQQLPRQVQPALQQASQMMTSGGNAMGAQLGPSAAQGIKSGTSQACDASADLGAAATKCAASALGVQSPSTAFAYLGSQLGPGLSQGAVSSIGAAAGAVGGAVTALTGAAAAGLTTTLTTQINSNGESGFAETGLKLGYVLGDNLVSGAQQVIQKNLLQSLTTPSGFDQQAMTALAATGLGAPAGSGASTWNMPQGLVSFAGAGSAANPAGEPAALPPIEATFNLHIDGNPIRSIADEQVNDALSRLMERIPRQRG